MSRVVPISQLFRKYIVTSSVIIFGLILLLTVGLFALSYEGVFSNEEEFFLKNQEENLVHEVKRVENLIEKMSSDWEEQYKLKLQKDTETAWRMAMEISSRSQGKIKKAELRSLITKALEAINFFDRKGFFALRDKENFRLYSPGDPPFNGLTIDLTQSVFDEKIKEQVDQILYTGEGVFKGDFTFRKGDFKTVESFTGFIRYFEPLDLFIGRGENFDYMEQELKSEVLNEISKIRYGIENKGYLFVNQMDGVALLISSPRYSSGDNISDITDPDGVKVFQIEKEAALKGGGIVHYKWYQENLERYSHNMTYVTHIEKWDWMVGAFADKVYVYNAIENQKNKLLSYLPVVLPVYLFLIALIVALYFLYTKKIGRRIRVQLDRLTHDIDYAIENEEEIDISRYMLEEFGTLSEYLNDSLKAKRLAEGKYELSEGRFQLIYENAPVMICSFGKKGEVILWNREMEKIFEISRKDVTGFESLGPFFSHEGQAEIVQKHMEEADGKFRLFEVRGMKGERLFQYWASFKTSDGMTINFGYNVTELKNSEMEHEVQKEFLMQLIESIPNPVFFKDDQGIYQFGNKHFAELIGVKQEEIKGKTVFDVSPANIAAKYEEMDMNLLHDGGTQVYEYHVQSGGELKYFMFSKAVPTNSEGDKLGIIGVMQDITDRKETEIAQKEREEILKEMNETKSKFFSIIAHDLRNPFTPILGYAELFQRKFKDLDDDDKLEMAKTIHSSSKRVYDLLVDLLNWSASQLEGAKIYQMKFTLHDVLESLQSTIEHSIQKKQIVYRTFTLAEDPVLADKNMIETVLRNLLINAIKFTPRCGKLQVFITDEETEMLVEVRDTGVGIPEHISENLFSNYQKKESLGTENEAGSGLGLLICKEFVEKNNGKIWVKSDLGKGSSFFFTVPKAYPVDNDKEEA